MKYSKLFRYVIVVSFLFSLLGWYPSYYLLRKSIKREMKQRIAATKDDSNSRYFIFTNEQYANLNWTEENEFRYDGEMYDIISEEKSEHGVLLYCFHDTRDSWLYDELTRQHDNNSANSGKANNMQRLLQSVHIVYTVPERPELICQICSREFNFDYRRSYTSHISDVCSPPPEV